MSKRERMVVWKSMFSPGDFMSSYRPKTGLAAARTLVRLLRTVVMPALAIEMVCCSIASWIATRSSSRICRGQAGHTAPSAHLVKLVDADDAAVGQDHRAALEEELALARSARAGKHRRTVCGSRWTDAVKPAADEPLPEV